MTTAPLTRKLIVLTTAFLSLTALAAWRFSFTTNAQSTSTIVYDVAADITAANPTGQWEYGQMTTQTGAFTKFDSYDAANRRHKSSTADFPYVNGGTPLEIIFHPADGRDAPAGQFAVARWRAPAAGTYYVQGRFRTPTGGGATTSVAVLRRAAGSATAALVTNSSGTSLTAALTDARTYGFAVALTLAVNETIEFTVGNSDGNKDYDSTVLSAFINAGERAFAYRAARDFRLDGTSATSANGAWKYGYTASPGSNSFLPYTGKQIEVFGNGDLWHNASLGVAPGIFHNKIGAPIDYDGVGGHQPGELNVHPGDGGQRSVLRWTAPVAGSYHVYGRFRDMACPATTDVRILKNGAVLSPAVSGVIDESGEAIYFSRVLTFAAGETIDFSVGYGANVSSNCDSTGVAVTITPRESSAACITAPDGIAARFPGDGNANDVQGTNHLTPHNGATFDAGKVGQAFSLDGVDDHLTAPDAPALRATNLTAEGWFRLASAAGDFPHIVSKPLGTGAGNSYVVWFDNGVLQAGVGNEGEFTQLNSGVRPAIGAWYHFALTFDDATDMARLYINGVQHAASATSISLAYDTHSLFIGGESQNETLTHFFPGNIDELTLYNRALTESEIGRIIAADSIGICKPDPTPTPTPTPATTFNPVSDFSTTQNPAGAWSYGVTQTRGAAFALMSNKGSDSRYSYWGATGSGPFVVKNTTGVTQTDGSRTHPPDMLNLDPSHDGRNAVVRWTATAAGTYRVNGKFQGLDTATTDVTVLKNSATTLASGNITSKGAQVPFDLTVAVAPGDTIDFSVGKGTNGSLYDATGLAATITQASACAAPPNGLVAWYQGENNANDSQGTNNGTLQNGATFAAGKVAQGFSFDGVNDHIRVPHNSSLNPTGSISVDAWVYPISSNGYNTILAKWTAENIDQRSYTFETNPAGKLEFRLSPNGGEPGVRLGTAISNSTLALNTWSHVAGVYDGSRVKVYINGVLEGDVAYNQGVFAGTSDLGIGAVVGAVPAGQFISPFAGFIDEASLYSHALTATEIAAIHNAGSAGKCQPTCAAPTGTVAWYKSEANAADAQGTHNGTLQNGATYAAGRVGQAFSFDGTNDYVSIPDADALDLTGDITIEGWIKPSNLSGERAIVSKRTLDNLNITYVFFLRNGQPIFATRRAGGSFTEATVTASVPANQFTHIAFTLSGADYTIYINGQPAGTAPFGGLIDRPATNGALTIGATLTNSGTPGAFAGLLDEVTLYNRALAGTEIAGIFNRGAAGKCGDGGTPTITYNGHTYRLTSAAKTWTQAQAEAVAAGGHLVTVNDAAEQAFLENTFLVGSNANRPLWIGFTDREIEGNYKWVSGEPVTYTNWNTSQPNNSGGNENYATINWHFSQGDQPSAKGKWNDTPDAGSSGFPGNTDGPYFGIIEIGSPAPPTPTPPTATAPAAWFRAGDLQAGQVSTWQDASGKGNNATQTNAARQPALVSGAINNQPAVRFDGSNDQLAFNRVVADDFTIVAVFKSTGGAANSSQWYGASGIVDAEVSQVTNDFGMSFTQDGRVLAGTGNPDVTNSSATGLNNGQPHVAVFRRNKATGVTELFVDGVRVSNRQAGTQSLNAPPRIVLGSLQTDIAYLNGDIAEVIVYSSALSSTERAQVESYLTGKYALTPAPDPTGGAELGISVDASDEKAEGEVITYKFEVTNYGGAIANNVRVVGQIPTHLTFESGRSDNGCTISGGIVTCSLGTLAPNAKKRGQIKAKVSSTGVLSFMLTAASDTAEPDPDPHPNFAFGQTNVLPSADVSLTITGPARVKTGQTMTFRMPVKNNGPSTAFGVELEYDVSGSREEFVSVEPSRSGSSGFGCNLTNGNVLCDLGSLTKNATLNVTLVMRAKDDGLHTADAEVRVLRSKDLNSLNNTVKFPVTITKGIDLSVELDAPAAANQGADIRLTARVTNAANSITTARNVLLMSGATGQATVVPGSLSSGSCTPSDFGINCIIPEIQPGSTLTYSYTLRPTQSGAITSFAAASPGETTSDTNEANNIVTRETLTCNPNAAPSVSFASSPTTIASAGRAFSYQTIAQDSAGKPLAYTLVQAPAGMTISPRGLVQWTPAASLRGSFNVRISASNNQCAGTAEQAFAVAVADPSIDRIQLGQLVITSSAIARVSGNTLISVRPSGDAPNVIEDGTYKLGGETMLNRFMRFDGDITAVVNKAQDRIDFQINQGKVYLVNIPRIGNKVLWEGGRVGFRVNGQGVLSAINEGDKFLQSLEVAKLSLGIQQIQILFAERGLRVNGNVKFPPLPGLSGLTGSFTSLELSQQNGVVFNGDIVLPNLSLGGFEVKNVRLRFRPDDSPARNPDRDTFEGEGTLVIPNTLTIVGKVKFIGGSLDSIMARVAVDPITGAGIPVPPLFSLTGGTVSVSGIGTGNFSIFLGVDITLADARLANFVKLTNAGIRYTAPGSLGGSSDLEILRTNIAEAALDFVNVPNEKSFAFDAGLVLVEGYPVLSVGGGVRIGAKRRGTDFSFFVTGTVRGKVQIPKSDNFVFNAIDAIPFVDFPIVLLNAEVSAGFPPAQFTYNHQLPFNNILNLAVRETQGRAEVLVAKNYEALGKIFSVGLSAGKLKRAGSQQAMLARYGRGIKEGDHLSGQGLYVPATPNAAQEIGQINVPANAPSIIVSVFAANAPGGARYSLIRPDNSRLTPETAEAAGAFYAQNADEDETYYIVPNPASGNWKVEVEDGTTGPFILDAAGADAPPAVTDVQVAPANGNGNFAVTYNATDANNEAKVSLYYDDDNQNFDGKLIADELIESASGSFTWQAADGSVPSGEYYVYAVIEDAVNQPGRKYAATKITVTDPLAPAIPQSVTAQPGGENDLVVSWSPNTESDLRGYQVLYGLDEGDATKYTGAVDAGRNSSARIPGLANTTAYRVRVVAYDQTETTDPNNPAQTTIESRRSAPSPFVTATTMIAIPPVVQVTAPSGGETFQADEDVTISWSLGLAGDIINQQVDVSLDNGATWTPLYINLDGEQRNVRWHVPSSVSSQGARVRVTAKDRAGNVGIGTSAASFAVSAPPVTLTPVADTWVQGADAFKNTNYGAATEMQVKRTLNPGAGRGRRGFLRFDTSSVAGEVTSARLRIFARLTDANLPATPMIIQKVDDTIWDEMTMTWNNQPPTASFVALSQITVAGVTGQYYEFDLTDFIRQERAAGRTSVSLRLINVERTGINGASFTSVNSKEASDNPPQLVIAR